MSAKVGGRTREEWTALLAAPGWGNTAREELIAAAFNHHAPGAWPDCPGCVRMVNQDMEGAMLNAGLADSLTTAQQRIEEQGLTITDQAQYIADLQREKHEAIAVADRNADSISALTKERDEIAKDREEIRECSNAAIQRNIGLILARDALTKEVEETGQYTLQAKLELSNALGRALAAESKLSTLEAEKEQAVESARTLGQQLERRAQGRDAETQALLGQVDAHLARISKLEEALRAVLADHDERQALYRDQLQPNRAHVMALARAALSVEAEQSCRACRTKAAGLPTPGYAHDSGCLEAGEEVMRPVELDRFMAGADTIEAVVARTPYFCFRCKAEMPRAEARHHTCDPSPQPEGIGHEFQGGIGGDCGYCYGCEGGGRACPKMVLCRQPASAHKGKKPRA